MDIHNHHTVGIDPETEKLTSLVRRSTKLDTAGGWLDGWEHEAVYTYENGNTVTLNAKSVDHMVLPANPGFELLTFELAGGSFADMDPDDIDIAGNIARQPVIGWAICSDRGESWSEAITEANGYGYTSTHSFKAISGPDGYFRWQHNCYMQTGAESRDIDDWVKSIRAELHHRKKTANAQREASGACPTCGRIDMDEPIPF